MKKRRAPVVLGINGWPERSHDAAAALLVGGRLVAMAEEERFVRQKHAYDRLPFNAIDACLEKARLAIDDVDGIAVGWNYPRLHRLGHVQPPVRWSSSASLLLPSAIFQYRTAPPVQYVDHHLAHAAGAFDASGFSEAAILVIDGQGESASTTIAIGNGAGIRVLRQFGLAHSLGYLYESVSAFVGLRTDGVGKLMGLAPYGDPHRYPLTNIRCHPAGYSIALPGLRRRRSGLDVQDQLQRAWFRFFQTTFGLRPNRAVSHFDQREGRLLSAPVLRSADRDLAASAQAALGRTILHLVHIAARLTRSRHLIITGGVALNCVANGKVTMSGLFDQYYFYPAAHDGGVAYGAATWAARRFGVSSFEPVGHASWGPSFSVPQIQAALTENHIPFRRLPRGIERYAATLLERGDVIGWFQGGMEVGPRALGNRSILADPRRRSHHDLVNRIKGREPWRPLAPSILAGYESQYFSTSYESPYMLVSAPVKPSQRRRIPAVVHVDGTSRYQSVNAAANSRFRRLLETFHRLTGVPLLLNTSFNRWDEPIVCTPMQAVRTFLTTPLDALIMEDCIVEKRAMSHGAGPKTRRA